MQNTKILIAEDHVIIRETWSFLLDGHPGLSVVGEVGTAEEAIQLAQQLNPDIVLMDINLPGLDGFEATQEINKVSPNSKVIGVSMHTQVAYVRKMIQKGAMGYVTKSSSAEELIEAIGDIMNGKTYICKEIQDVYAKQVAHEPNADGNPLI